MRIHLVRHGQTSAELAYDAALGYPDPELSDTGISQAQMLGQRLRNHRVEAIYSSDLKRAGETAKIIGQYTNTDIIFKPQLREINMGKRFLTGWDAFSDFHKEWRKHEADLPYPGGEAGIDVKKRAWPILEEIKEQYNHDVVFVTHGGVIMILLSACLGMGLEKRFGFAPPENCSNSVLLYDPIDRKIRVEKINDTAHLDIYRQEFVRGRVRNG